MSPLALHGGTPLRKHPWPAWPQINSEDIQAVSDVVQSGTWGVGGTRVPKLEATFSAHHGAKYGIATSSGTTALQVALSSIGVGPGDEVIVPSYTFIATASCVLLVGARPVMVDVEADTYNIDPIAVEAAITGQTKAIIVVHFAGLAVDFEKLLAISHRTGVPLIEDACHAHGGVYGGNGLGTIGLIGCFSFQSSKNLTSGEGGMILTNEEHVARRCRSLVNIGRAQNGLWYEHHNPGGNYRLSEIHAALLLSQMNKFAAQTLRRHANGIYLDSKIITICGLAPMRASQKQSVHSRHLYAFRFNREKFGISRDSFIKYMDAEGIPLSAGYVLPLHLQPLFTGRNLKEQIPGRTMLHLKNLKFATVHRPNAEHACAEEAVWINQRILLAEREDMDDIITAIMKITGAVNNGKLNCAPHATA
jgi:dTDP-4-amino-4,6-dideoxygalactose transaminase